MTPVLSGQAGAYRIIHATLARGRLAGCYLFYGPPGVGQAEVARYFGRAILCWDGRQKPEEGSGGPCEQCPQCQLSLSGRHADLMVMTPEMDGAGNPIIRIEDVRNMQQLAVVHPGMARHRLIIIEQAESMQVETANCLLKLLEEPPPFGVFLLTTDNLEAMLPTIRSRAQKIRITPSRGEEIEQRLQVAGVSASQAKLAARLAQGRMEMAHAVLSDAYQTLRSAALALLEAAVSQGEAVALKATEAFKVRDSARQLVGVWQSCLRDAVLWRGGCGQDLLLHSDLSPKLQRIFGDVPTVKLIGLWESAFALEENLANNANVQLALDDWLVSLIEVAGSGSYSGN